MGYDKHVYSTEQDVNRRRLGTEQEMVAADYLRSLGYRILAHSWRCRIGEIDLIAEDADTIVFVEVKYRGSSRCGSPEEAVNVRKRQTIYRAAQLYLLQQGKMEDTPCRFDVISVYGDQIRHFKDAFGGM